MNKIQNEIINILDIKIPENLSFIRLGSKYDGGYVVVNNFLNTDYLVSFGIANNIDFEQQMSNFVSGMDLYDFSINSLPQKIKNSRFFIEKVDSDHDIILDRVKDKEDLILKVDIEGSEWNFFKNISEENINKFKQIILEVHWMVEIEGVKIPDFRIDVIEKINKTHQIVALHPNNYSKTVNVAGLVVPQVLEITFLRKLDNKFIEGTPPKNLFYPNNPNGPDIKNYLIY